MTAKIFSSELLSLIAKSKGFTSDSRKVAPGFIFIALKGESFDGHDFLEEAIGSGASACICDMGRGQNLEDVFEVPNTALAHRELARLFRERFPGKVIAIGGSNGKTSTKDFLYDLLKERFQVIKTLASQNGYLGIPATFERLNENLDFAVIEVGTDGPGDIVAHCKIVQPDIVALSSIGEEHLRQLKDLQGVFDEESQLAIDCLSRGGHVFVPEDDTWLAKLLGKENVHPSASFPDKLRSPVNTPLQIHGIALRNYCLAVSVAQHIGLTREEIEKATERIQIPDGRGKLHTLEDGNILIEDHYNANLSSMKESLNEAKRLKKASGRTLVLVLGDMLDLGEDSQLKHQELFQLATKSGAELIFTVGSATKESFGQGENVRSYANSTELSRDLKSLLPENSIVLFKGSRGMHLETAIQALKN